MRFFKVRIIQSGGGTVTGGVSIPQEIFVRWQNTFVEIKESGSGIIIVPANIPEPLTNKELVKDSISNALMRI